MLTCDGKVGYSGIQVAHKIKIMKSIELKAEKRTEVGKKSTKQLRKEKKVPCVLYGGEKNIHFTSLASNFRPLIFTPNSYIVNLDVDGEKFIAILKDSQFHPVSDEILHLDFLQVFEENQVNIHVPVVLTGFAEGVKEGGKLRQDLRKIFVKAFMKDLPDFVEVAIDELNVGESVLIKDLTFDNLELLVAESRVVAAVVLTRASISAVDREEGEEGEEGAAEGAEGAEGAEVAEPTASK